MLVAVQPARLAMRVSQGDLRVRCQDHDLDDCEEGGVHVILPGTRGQSLLAGPWLVEVQFNIVCPSQSYLMIFLRIYLMILPRPPSRLAWN